jgi:hypothetical protein
MPTYRYLRDALTLPLRYNPTGEFIFPCIRGVYDKISGARGRYYLYYAPHEKPGGICVAWANSLNGPFTEHTGNPIIDNVLPGGGTVSHVSSPHVTWNAATRQFFLYWHGENTTTRVARSSDGINFRDETPILSTRLVPGLTETSYARVFAHNGRYVMVYMGVLAGKRRIYHGWSPNGWDQWQFAQTPLVNPEPDGLTDISGPSLVQRPRPREPPGRLLLPRGHRQRPGGGPVVRDGRRRGIHVLRGRPAAERPHLHRPSRLTRLPVRATVGAWLPPPIRAPSPWPPCRQCSTVPG